MGKAGFVNAWREATGKEARIEESGTVKMFNKEKGYGFIQREDGRDIYVHKNDLENAETLSKGEEVTYNLLITPIGRPKAIYVRVKAEGTIVFLQYVIFSILLRFLSVLSKDTLWVKTHLGSISWNKYFDTRWKNLSI